MRYYGRIRSKQVQRNHTFTLEQEKLIKHLYFNSTDNTLPSLAKESGMEEYLINEIVSRFIKVPVYELNLEETMSFADTSEQGIIERSSDEKCIEIFNTNCHSSPDFNTRLLTIKSMYNV